MKKIKVIYKFLRNKLDLFGKDPQFYYNKKEKKNTNIGFVFSLLYFGIYIGYLIYKLLKMINYVNGEFTDSNINPENPDSINLTNENFYLGFAIEDPITYDTILDETIYYPKAYFKKGTREGKEWEWDVKELELEPCKLEKFGSKYQEIFSRKYLGLHYCFKEMNETLEGHFSYDMYSMFYISLFPCKNSTENNNHCKPLEEIDYYLKGTFVTMQFEDILLTPNNYDEPIKGRDQDLYTTVGKKLFKELYLYFKIINIETDLDFIGIDEIKKVKNEKYIKYDSYSQMTKLLDQDVYETGESFCDITLKLSDLVFYQKRTYTKLLDILGDVGGLMEILNTIFGWIISFPVDILYETSLVNKLFEFEIYRNKKNKLKRVVTINIKNYQPNNSHKENFRQKPEKILINNFINGGISSKDQIENGMPHRDVNYDNQNYEINNKNDRKQINHNNEEQKQEKNIKQIKHNKFCLYFCFLFYSNRKIKPNILIEKGMELIKKDLDVSIIFKKLYQQKDNEEGDITK